MTDYASSGNVGAKLESEKSKDIRATNIVAAKGKFSRDLLMFYLSSCFRCRPYISWSPWHGQNGKCDFAMRIARDPNFTNEI